MLITNNARKFFFKYPYMEAISIMLIYIVIGYMNNPEDVLMINMDFSFLTIILAIITLFHGISSGLLVMLILAIVMHYAYTEVQYLYYLKEFVLVMIYGEFHYYWNRIINHHTTEGKFIHQKLSELSRAFYMLKISHDQIEKSYVVKPMSLRNSIIVIKEKHKGDTSSSYYKEFLHLLQKTLNIESAFLLSVASETDMSVLAQTDSNEILDIQDLLIQDAYTKQMPLYVSADGDHEESRYLASIPLISYEKIVGMLVISKMPFMSFSKDNLISATILGSYMFDEMEKINILQKIGNFLPQFQSNFRFEAYRLYHLKKEFGTDTTMLLFKSYNKLSIHLLMEVVGNNLRKLDMMSRITVDDFDIIAVLFPFADETSVKGFSDRVYSKEDIKEHSKHIMYTSLSIKDTALIEEYIEGAV